MATAVPSRFAVLAIDDDDSKPKKSKKTPASTNNNNDNKNVNNKQLKNKSNNKSKTQAQPVNAQPKKDDKKKSKNKKKKVEKESQQWEQWKEKDSMSVEETYKQQLHEALLLSKLAYEEQKENSLKKSPDHIDHTSKKSTGNKNNKKSATMSLEEFNNLNSANNYNNNSNNNNNNNSNKAIEEPELDKPKESDVEFFDRLEKETKQELIKNKQRDILKSRLNKLDDDITLAQLKVEVEKRDNEILELKKTVAALKDELSQVKERNKKLCNILAVGEMKDKASVIVEVDKLKEIRDELTNEVSSLHAQLEQERSKSRTSSADLKNNKNKKKMTNDTA